MGTVSQISKSTRGLRVRESEIASTIRQHYNEALSKDELTGGNFSCIRLYKRCLDLEKSNPDLSIHPEYHQICRLFELCRIRISHIETCEQNRRRLNSLLPTFEEISAYFANTVVPSLKTEAERQQFYRKYVENFNADVYTIKKSLYLEACGYEEERAKRGVGFSEFEDMFSSHGNSVSELKIIFDKYDVDRNKIMSFNEFLYVMIMEGLTLTKHFYQ